ncbi:hypothetical protein [Sulfurovum sp.]|uniref:hypothetical protein n=1 Tax=Sulfurovum sp. TaxID=1969726 RepID=UPI002867F52E|nr:hypothetical protein [Sulfurovum sp.]
MGDGNILISTKYVKSVIYFFLEALMVISIVIFVIQYLDMLPTISSGKNKLMTADSMAVANTFMVFVTFLVVIGTVGITVVGLYLSRWWSREKKQVLAENWSDMMEEVKKDKNLMSQLKEELLSDSLEEMMKDHISKHNSEIRKTLKTEIQQAEKRIFAKIKSNLSDSAIDMNLDDIILDILDEEPK